MCLAVPGKIKKIEGGKVTLDYGTEERYALAGDAAVAVGDFVMVQMGVVVKILSKTEAKSAMSAWKSQKALD